MNASDIKEYGRIVKFGDIETVFYFGIWLKKIGDEYKKIDNMTDFLTEEGYGSADGDGRRQRNRTR
jgi:hypothetical protein